MKLTKTKLIETLRRKNEGWTTYQARKIARVSVRRVNQVWKQYTLTGEIPEIGKNNGRPKKPIEQWEIDMVKQAYEKYRVSASTLTRLIERDYGKHINHNRIHTILLNLGYAKKKDKKDIRKKKWIRYERRHSLSLIHIDWYYDPIKEQWVFGVEDDASRKVLSLIESLSPTTELSIDGVAEATKYGSIKQCISDHGSQFVSNIGGDSRFAEFLSNINIHQIFSKIKHPQSNGKIERWFDVYKNHRHAFQTKEEFLRWYNEVRPHRSLNFKVLETPQQAFIRKMRTEV
jgi:putative transposase